MDSPFVDIHTHHAEASENITVYSYQVGSGGSLFRRGYSAGIHPWDATRTDLHYPTPNDCLIAIGEIGLDFATALSAEDRTAQERIFRDQMRLAQEMQLPVIIHCVRAYNELIQILKQYHVTTIIHGFRGSSELASQLLDVGCYLSFGEAILTSSKVVSALKQIPSKRLFLETDQSKLSIETIYDGAASIRGYSVPLLREQIYNNYLRVFKNELA